ncbi:hypothetical protein DL93DRAFT_2169082 [Clavulina sp. PMI_390]|nr:hypothetical protein DL93DRAFT_2169082 [Clavulina sp. PMI_390]
MLKALGVAEPSLGIELEENTFFLRPCVIRSPGHDLTLTSAQSLSFLAGFTNSNSNPELPSEDVVVKGILTLVLPKPKKIKSITVKVVTDYNIQSPKFGYESGKITVAEEQLQSSGHERLYDKGEHLFSFALIIPSSSATFDKSDYGRILHTVNAIALGEGIAGSNVKTSIPIYLIGNPARVGQTSDLNLRMEGFHEQLGPYAISTAAQHLTVGGLLHFNALLAAVPQRTRIISVSATLMTNYKITSLQRPSQAPQFASTKTKFFAFDANNLPCIDARMVVGDGQASADRLDVVEGESGNTGGETMPPLGSSISSVPNNTSQGESTTPLSDTPPTGSLASPETLIFGQSPTNLPPSTTRSKGRETRQPLTIIERGGSYHVTHLARIPNDVVIRPSTLEGTKTPLETKHELIIDIVFSSGEADNQPSKPLVLRTEHPITLSSVVPAYTEALSPPMFLPSKSPPTHSCWETKYAGTCICMASNEELLKQYREADERLRTGHTGRVWGDGGLGTTTVVSWDDLSGHKLEYEPIERAQA